MASLSREAKRDSWKLTWYVDTKRKAIRLGSMPKKTAEQFRVKFEELLGIKRGNGSIPQALSEWLNTLDKDLREKIEEAGLVERKKRYTLSVFLSEYRATRVKVALATAVRDRQVCDLLIERFGKDRALETITARDAEEWQSWLATSGNKRDSRTTKLEGNTVRRRTGTARQMFSKAIRWKIISANPFDGLATSVLENKERQVFVSFADILKVIAVAPTMEWKALIAFCRLVGPRVPSELVGLTWADVDFVSKRIVLKSPKTKHHGGEHALRSCPMFPELVPFLEKLSEAVGPGILIPLSSPVFPVACDPGTNLRTTLSRLVVQAGLTPWQKLFVNLRSSRETELLAVFPVADVCNWFGHSPAVAARFYAQSRTEIADRACSETTLDLAGAQAGAHGSALGAQMGDIIDRQEEHKSHQDDESTNEKPAILLAGDGCENVADGATSGRYWTRTNDPHDVNVVL